MPVQLNLRRCGSRIHPGGVTNCSMENSMGGEGIPPDRTMGPVWVAEKRRAREGKEEKKRGLFRVPQPSSLMKKWNPWDCHRNSFSDSSDVASSDTVGRQSRFDGLWV